jgi:hypothetical protein
MIFQRSNFAQPAKVTLGLTESGIEKGIDQILRHRWSDRSAAHTDDVHVIVLNPLPGRKVIVNQSGANAGDLIGTDRSADTAATNRNAPLYFSGSNGPREGSDVVGIVIAGIEVVCSEISHLVPGLTKMSDQLFLQGEATMIGGDSNTHLIFSSLLVGVEIQCFPSYGCLLRYVIELRVKEFYRRRNSSIAPENGGTSN